MELFFHPFSSYSQKALIAFYEKEIPFHERILSPDDASAGAEMHALWPIDRFPVLRDGDRTIVEATSIIEHLEVAYGDRARLIPDDPARAVDARMRDRIFDNYVMTPAASVVFNRIRPEPLRDPHGDVLARKMLDKAYAWLDAEMGTREWATGDTFTLADCAAAPSLFYADWTHPFGARFPNLAAYRKRLNTRPSFARCIEGGRPYRKLFPLGAPDRD